MFFFLLSFGPGFAPILAPPLGTMMAKLGTSVVSIDSVAISSSKGYVMEQGRDGAAGKHRPCAGHGRGVLLFV
jgi:hypothetical protein